MLSRADSHGVAISPHGMPRTEDPPAGSFIGTAIPRWLAPVFAEPPFAACVNILRAAIRVWRPVPAMLLTRGEWHRVDSLLECFLPNRPSVAGCATPCCAQPDVCEHGPLARCSASRAGFRGGGLGGGTPAPAPRYPALVAGCHPWRLLAAGLPPLHCCTGPPPDVEAPSDGPCLHHGFPRVWWGAGVRECACACLGLAPVSGDPNPLSASWCHPCPLSGTRELAESLPRVPCGLPGAWSHQGVEPLGPQYPDFLSHTYAAGVTSVAGRPRRLVVRTAPHGLSTMGTPVLWASACGSFPPRLSVLRAPP